MNRYKVRIDWEGYLFSSYFWADSPAEVFSKVALRYPTAAVEEISDEHGKKVYPQ